MGLYQEALRHFAAVSRCAESARDRAGVLVFAAAHTAMTELEAGGEAAIFRACEALKEAGVYSDVPATLPENVRWGSITWPSGCPPGRENTCLWRVWKYLEGAASGEFLAHVACCKHSACFAVKNAALLVILMAEASLSSGLVCVIVKEPQLCNAKRLEGCKTT